MARASLRPSPKLLVVMIVAAAFVFVGCGTGYYLAARKVAIARAEMNGKKKQVDAAQEMAGRLEKSRLAYLDAASQIRFLESSVSTKAYVPTLLRQLEFLAKSVDLRVVSVRPQPKVEPPPDTEKSDAQKAEAAKSEAKKTPSPYDELKIDVEVKGHYMNALDFMYRLTTFPKIIAINTVQMLPETQADYLGSPSLKVTYNVTAYVLRAESEKAKKETSARSRSTHTAGQGGTENEAG